MEKGELQQFRSEDYLPFLDEVISRWFNQNYSEITEPQRRAIPLIHQKNNVLVSSPTGTGKTLTGFLSIINELLTLARNDELEDNIYCVYVSPLKALANDIDKNLRKPLDGIYKILRDEGQDLKKITLGVRSGDTPQSERQKMLRKPPNILITTPESLSLALSAPKFREKFASVRWAIIDEIHEISSTKRGSLLSVNLERLEALSGNLIRIGLSATQAPLDLIAEYLCGFKDGKPRPHEIIDVDTKKFLDLRTVTPVSDLTQYSSEVANNMMYDVLARYIAEHVTTIVFTNTRSSTEHVAIRLKARGVESIEAHHSSLGKETRHEVENKLKDGELKCVITSTSLELGIDIGYVDLVVQIGSPKSVSKGLQRIGRSGHGIHDLSMGRFLVFDLDDLMECAVLTKAAYDKDIDLVRIPRNPLDVLAQVIVGMSLEKTWDADEAYSVITSSFTFNTLSRDDYLSSLDYLSGSLDAGGIYPKIWYDKSEGRFGKKKSTRMIYYMNIGTIPDESDYKVINERGKHLGQLSEKFVERLKAGDVFVLGARTYLYIRTTRNRILVKDAVGLRPTVPSWTGEMLPRSYDLGRLIGKFRLELSGKLAQGDDVRNWLMEDYMLDASGAESMLSYMKNQSKFDIPTDSHLYVEGYTDDSGNYNIIFHVPLGRRVNDALSRAFAQAMSNKYNVNLRITVTDDGFMLTSSVRIPIREGIKTVSEANFEDMVRRSIWNTEVFKQRFRHCAARSLMVLRKYKGYDISVARQQLRSDKVLKYLESFRNFPVLKETFREIMEEMMDVPYAREYVKDVIDTGNYTIREYSPEPSPFSHGIILAGVSDIVLMEDRAKLLRQLQSKILDKVYGPGTFRFLLDDARSVELYFSDKVPRIMDEDSYISFSRYFLLFDPHKSKFNSPFPYADVAISDITEELIERDEIVSVFARGTQWTHISSYGICRNLFASRREVTDLDTGILELCTGRTFNELKRESMAEENDLRNSLIKLESSYLIRKKYRSGTVTYVKNELEVPENREAHSIALYNVLSTFGPLTVDEILIKLPVDQDILTAILEDGVRSGKIVHDYITPVYSKQYILREDLDALLKSAERDVLRERNLSITREVSSADEYYEQFGFSFDNWSLMVRGVKNPDREIERLLEEKKIFFCRAIKKRPGYLGRWLLDSIYALRYEQPSKEEQAVLESIASGYDSEGEIQARTALEKRITRQVLSVLEYHLFIRRDGSHYAPFMVGPPKIGREEALRNIISRFGPVSSREISHYFWADVGQVPADITSSYYRGEVYYGEARMSGNETALILPLSDPVGMYLERNYSRASSVNGILLVDGQEAADFEMESGNGVCWIEGVEGREPGQDSMQKAMENMVGSGYVDAAVASYSSGEKSISVGSIETASLDRPQIFEMSVSSYLGFESREQQPYLILKNSRLGFRIESEFSRLGLNERQYDTYYRSNLLFNFSGPYSNSSIGSLDTISLYRDLRGQFHSDIERDIVEFIEGNRYATEHEIRSSVRGAGIGLRAYLKNLYDQCIMARDATKRYVYVPPGKGREDSLEQIIRYIADRFGYCEESKLLLAIPGATKPEVSLALKELVKKKVLHEVISPAARSVLYLGREKAGKVKGDAVIFPKESFSLYHKDYIKNTYGSPSLFLYVKDGKVEAVFRARKKGYTLAISRLEGDRSYRDSIKKTLNNMGYAVTFT